MVALVSYPSGLYFVSEAEKANLEKQRTEYLLEQQQKQAKKPQRVSKRQLECLRQALWFEARGEPEIGIRAVASVIKNRVESKHYPSTYCRVINQRKQFSYVHERQNQGKSLQISAKKSERMKLQLINKIVQEIAEGKFKVVVPNKVLWYHTTAVKPKWSTRKRTVAVIGQHVFKAKS